LEARAGFRTGKRPETSCARLVSGPLDLSIWRWHTMVCCQAEAGTVVAIYSLNHKSVGRATHAPGTASAHVQYIMRPRAASEIIAHQMPDRMGPAMSWMG